MERLREFACPELFAATTAQLFWHAARGVEPVCREGDLPAKIWRCSAWSQYNRKAVLALRRAIRSEERCHTPKTRPACRRQVRNDAAALPGGKKLHDHRNGNRRRGSRAGSRRNGAPGRAFFETDFYRKRARVLRAVQG